jgi:hypothetical protein
MEPEKETVCVADWFGKEDGWCLLACAEVGNLLLGGGRGRIEGD